MKRNAILCGLLVAACGGGNKQAVTTSDLGPSQASTAEPVAAAATRPADPQSSFRRQYSNPGGMWMPAQMTLPQHADTFQKMGVQIGAEKLSDPLSDPLAAIVS